MKRQIHGLHDADLCSLRSRSPMDCSSFAWSALSIAGTHRSPIYLLRSAVLEPRELAGTFYYRPPLLHSQSPLETQLVPA